MRSTPFNPETDLAPIPFSEDVCQAAKIMKENGLQWKPHVGCFVWDELKRIEVSSPFPHRVYFILNLGHFLRRFETIENMIEGLIWLPTWHQALKICQNLDIPIAKILEEQQIGDPSDPDDGLVNLYRLIGQQLSRT